VPGFSPFALVCVATVSAKTRDRHYCLSSNSIASGAWSESRQTAGFVAEQKCRRARPLVVQGGRLLHGPRRASFHAEAIAESPRRKRRSALARAIRVQLLFAHGRDRLLG
jgi:hypothetical protein